MYLYEKKDNEIHIYELVSDDEKLRKFREDELKTQENIFWYSDTLIPKTPSFAKTKNESNFLGQVHKIFENITSTMCINQKSVSGEYGNDRLLPTAFNHALFNNYCIGTYDLNPIVKIGENIVSYSPEDQKLLDDYKNELEDYHKRYISAKKITERKKIWGINEPNYRPVAPTYPNVKKIVSTNIIQYLIPTEKEYDRVNDMRLRMVNIISIPKSLYLLNMFLQGNIDEISGENIDTQLEFFTLNPSPILTIPIEHLEKLIQYNLVKYSYDNIDELFCGHQKILKKLK